LRVQGRTLRSQDKCTILAPMGQGPLIEQESGTPMVKTLLWVGKLAVSIGLIAWLVQRVDLTAVASHLKQASIPTLAVAPALLLVQALISAERWRQVMNSIGVALPLGWLIRTNWIGAFINLLVPGAIGGDAFRAWQTHKRGVALTSAVNGVMLERIITVLSLTLMVSVMLPLLVPDLPGQWGFRLLAVAGIAGIAVLMVLDRAPEALLRWRIIRGFAVLAEDTRRLFLSPRRLLPPLAWAFIGNANLAMAALALARGLGAEISVFDALVLVPPVILITALPISISGWGTRELAMVTALGLVGVPGDIALTTSILFGLTCLLTGLPGGLFWLLSDEPTPADGPPAS